MTTRTLMHAAIAGFLVTSAGAADARAQEAMTPQQLFDAGRYQDVLHAIPQGAGDDARFLAAQSHLRLSQPDEAKARLQELGGGDENNAWTYIGRAGVAQVDGDFPGSEAAARRAVELNGALAEAHYQLGQSLYAASNWSAAADAFAQAAQLSPGYAYAHYFAGQSFYRAKRVDRMAQHFEYFLKLAPAAPERSQVDAVMRTVRGR